MGKGPDAPDPFAQAAAQQAAELGASQGSSIINNPNQYNPYGSQTYSIAGYETIYDAQGKPQYVPRYNQTTTLSPDQMKLLGPQHPDPVQSRLDRRPAVGLPERLPRQDGRPVDHGRRGRRASARRDLRQDQGPTDRRAVEAAHDGPPDARRWASDPPPRTPSWRRAACRPAAPSMATCPTRATRAMTDAQQQAYLGLRAGEPEPRRRPTTPPGSTLQMGRTGRRPQQCAARSAGQRNLRAPQPADQRNLGAAVGLASHQPDLQPVLGAGHQRGPGRPYMGQNYANELQPPNAQTRACSALAAR